MDKNTLLHALKFMALSIGRMEDELAKLRRQWDELYDEVKNGD